MTPSLEETVYLDFITSSSTGAAADADSTPTAEVFEDATDTTVVALTVTKRTGKTGNYRVPVPCTAANGFEAGKTYNVIASATVGGVAAKAKVGTFQVRARDTDDLSTLAAGAAMTLTAAERTAVANEVEAQIIDETDSEKVLTAITDKIASVNPSLSGLTLAAIASAVRDVLNTSPAANSLGAMVKATADRMPGAGTLATTADIPTPPTAASIADAVWDEARSGHTTDGTYGDTAEWTGTSGGAPSAAEVADAVWDEARSGHAAAGSFGEGVRLAAGAVTTDAIADDAITDAKIAVPAETAGRPTRALAMLRRAWEWTTNKRTRDRSTGILALRNAADSANLETQTQSTTGSVDTQTKGA